MKKLQIVDAECKRVLERSDTLCADVEVKIAGEERTLIAMFTESKDNDYDMSMVLLNDADRELDWYDNDLHAAYEDVTVSLFADEAGETHWGPREEFKLQVLNHGTVRADIRRMLAEAKHQQDQPVRV